MLKIEVQLGVAQNLFTSNLVWGKKINKSKCSVSTWQWAPPLRLHLINHALSAGEASLVNVTSTQARGEANQNAARSFNWIV